MLELKEKKTMTLLHTEYYCDHCRLTLRKQESMEHKWNTGHDITKKVIYPSEIFDQEPTLVIEPSKPVELNIKEVDFCIDCSKEVIAPKLHTLRGHLVFKKKV